MVGWPISTIFRSQTLIQNPDNRTILEDNRLGRWVVCSAWPYVNDRPHLGTFTHLLSADVYARYLRLKGEDVVMVSGSDEHGAPIEVEAIKRKITPRQLTNQYHRVFTRSIKAFNIQFDNYTRTESPVHKKFVQEFYRTLDKNGYVFKQNIILPICENDKRFLPDRFVEGECPYCHYIPARGDQCDNCGRVLDPKDLINPYCVLDHSTPIMKESASWFFDLPKLSEQLKKYVEENPNLPENARNFSLSWIRDGLKPRSLTRDLAWGIPAPFEGAQDKTICVWIDEALELEDAEYWRYALISLRPEQRDTNFTWEEFERKINTELNDVVGNFIHRTISFISTRFKNKIPKFTTDKERDQDIFKILHEAPKRLDERLERFRLKEGLEQVVQLAREGNRYLNESAPWHSFKTDPAEAGQTLGLAAQIVGTIGIQLQPFLPITATRIHRSLFLGTKPNWQLAGAISVKPGARIKPMQPLFHKVSAQNLRTRLEETRSGTTTEAET